MPDVNRGVDRHKTKANRDQFAMVRDQFQIKLIQAKLSASELAIGTLLAMHFNRDHFAVGEGLVAWPGLETLAKQAMMPKRTVQRAIRELQKRKLFFIIEGGGKQRGNEGRSHRYIAIHDIADPAIPRRNGSSYHDEMVTRPLKGPLSKSLPNGRRLSEGEERALAGFDDFERYPGPERLQ
jgi:hypothetical protein